MCSCRPLPSASMSCCHKASFEVLIIIIVIKHDDDDNESAFQLMMS